VPCSNGQTVPVRELCANLNSLLDEVSDRRDNVLVTRKGVPAAALVPIRSTRPWRRPPRSPHSGKGLREIERGETITLAELRKE
jgi:prevent-host-death family protein